MKGNTKMTLKDIAKQANVSPSTVSLVLHNKPGVSKKTRKHISRMLLENGYNINFEIHDSIQRSIRFLKYSKHSLLVNGNAGFVTAIIDAVEKESRLQGYNLVMTVFGENNETEWELILRLNQHIHLDKNLPLMSRWGFPFA
jgi:DNA-binding LacI/PurR family transcriptional regulator